jgi:alpha-D-xyloside xylohydrolase
VYKGKDGKFSLYEDEGTNYNYEKGAFSTISFEYNDAEGTLTIDDRKGSFEEMLTNRTFRVVFIGKSNSEPKTVQYNGYKTVIKL